ncbi:MAG: hypothetical protein QMD07_08970, partial [Thermodesulfovibrionales bacterium]|nr:hypothetical protein [Thermodesulfovibrionales bacterium]
MSWEYIEVKFGVRFGHGQIKVIERKRFFGGIDKYYEMPKEISWEVIAISNPKTEMLLSGTVKEHSYRAFNILGDFKTVCFQYIQKLGTEGWELVGEMPETFLKASNNIHVSLYLRHKDHRSYDDEWGNYLSMDSITGVVGNNRCIGGEGHCQVFSVKSHQGFILK